MGGGGKASRVWLVMIQVNRYSAVLNGVNIE